MSKPGLNDNAETGSTPAGNGGRVKRQIFRTREGFDATVEPEDGHIYSGMLKRTALETGKFADPSKRE